MVRGLFFSVHMNQDFLNHSNFILDRDSDPLFNAMCFLDRQGGIQLQNQVQMLERAKFPTPDRIKVNQLGFMFLHQNRRGMNVRSDYNGPF